MTPKLQNSPRVSILIPVYNAEIFLTETVRSVQAQTYPSWEALLIIDPLSSDRSASLAEELARTDPRIRVVRANQPGVSSARNQGLDLTEGEFVAFLDSDDVWLPCKLETQLQVMSTPERAWTCTAFRRLNENGSRLGRVIAVPARVNRLRLLQQNSILCSSVVIRRNLLGERRFPSVGCEDFALWLQLLRGHTYCYGVATPLVKYRVVKGSRGANKWRTLRESWCIYRAQEKLGFAPALMALFLLITRGALKHSRF